MNQRQTWFYCQKDFSSTNLMKLLTLSESAAGKRINEETKRNKKNFKFLPSVSDDLAYFIR